MADKTNKTSGAGLDRSVGEHSLDWIRSSDVVNGVERMQAWFRGAFYRKHRHDTYAICLTTAGVQAFDYRGASRISTPGKVVVLHPDELHDGRAGTEEGLGYHMLYVDPALVYEAAQVLRGKSASLPFVASPVVANRKLSAAINSAFQHPFEPIAIDSLVLQLAEGLADEDPCCGSAPMSRPIDLKALKRAKGFLDAEKTRVVRSAELEAVTGLTRYELARQFRRRHGTSPYRYLLMRRLEVARREIAKGRPLAEVASATGFADQAHLTRLFKATFGMTPGKYALLRANEG